MKRFRFYFGILFILIGVFFLVGSFSGITGLVVFEELGRTTGSVLGIVFVVGGILLMMAREGRSKLEEESDAHVRLERTDQFERAIKKHDLSKINAALRKIGTGLGKEHQLTTGDYSISVSKGGRIVYEYDDSRKSARLIDYDESHDYDRMLRGRR